MRRPLRHLWPVLVAMLAWPATANAADVVPGEVLVRFKEGTTAGERGAVRASEGTPVRRSLRIPGVQLLATDLPPEEAARKLEGHPEVEHAQPNYLYELFATPTDPRFGELWGLHNVGQAVGAPLPRTADADIDAPEAWDTTTGSSAVKIAVTDTGVAFDHPDLAPNIASSPAQADFISGGDARDMNSHGTHVAGTIAARGNDGFGVAGVNWSAGIVPIRVCLSSGACSTAAIADGFDYAGDSGVDVVNASFGGSTQDPVASQAIEDHPGTLFVVAAGNAGSNLDAAGQQAFPCEFPFANVICVAATDQDDALSSFSNFGSTTVDLAAPGRRILSTVPDFDFTFVDGFESGLGAWTQAGGTWSAAAEAAFAGSFGLTDSAGGPYANSLNKSIQRSVDLSGEAGCALEFQMRHDLENQFDFLRVEADADGTGEWTQIGAVTGSSAGSFKVYTFDLDRFDGDATTFIRFRLTTDTTITRDGVHIDNVFLRCAGTITEDDFQTFQGTSMATPHVAGIAGLLFAAKPTATVAEVRNALLTGAEPKPSLAGKTVTGARANARRSLDILLPPTAASAAAPEPAPGPPPAGPAAQVAGVTTAAPLAVSSRIGRQRLADVLRRGLLVLVSSTRDGRATVELLVDSRTGKRFKLAASVRVGRRSARVKAGATPLRVKLTRRARTRLKRARTVRLQVRSTVVSGSDRRRGRLRRVTLR